jgi:DNA-binding IclR family transcriptional regulator
MISSEERAFQVLMKLGGCATSEEIAHELGLPGPRPSTRAGNLMRGLIQAGRVERLGRRGIYRIRRLVAMTDVCLTP